MLRRPSASFQVSEVEDFMDHRAWRQCQSHETTDQMSVLELNPEQRLEVYTEDGGKTWHGGITSHGEGIVLFFGAPSLEDAKTKIASMLQTWYHVALMSAFR